MKRAIFIWFCLCDAVFAPAQGHAQDASCLADSSGTVRELVCRTTEASLDTLFNTTLGFSGPGDPHMERLAITLNDIEIAKDDVTLDVHGAELLRVLREADRLRYFLRATAVTSLFKQADIENWCHVKGGIKSLTSLPAAQRATYIAIDEKVNCGYKK